MNANYQNADAFSFGKYSSALVVQDNDQTNANAQIAFSSAENTNTQNQTANVYA